jgi:hypothetical protein
LGGPKKTLLWLKYFVAFVILLAIALNLLQPYTNFFSFGTLPKTAGTRTFYA